VINCKTSADGKTTKMLIALQDGLQVEAVIMTYDTGVYCAPITLRQAERWMVLCVMIFLMPVM